MHAGALWFAFGTHALLDVLGSEHASQVLHPVAVLIYPCARWQKYFGTQVT
jgi:hypothetical protein